MIRPESDRVELEEAIQELGGVRDEFRPAEWKLMAARIIGPFVCLVGLIWVIAPLYLRTEWTSYTIFLVVLGVVAIFTGSAIGWSSFHLASYRLLLCRDGIIQVQGKIRTILWDAVTSVDEIGTRFREGSVPLKIWTIHYRSKDQQCQIKINRETVSEVKRLMHLIHDEVEQRNINWNTIGYK